MTRSLSTILLLAAALALGADGAAAKTPDGETPAVEHVCDDLAGAAFGLCNAFCEAQDCELQEELDTSCLQLLESYRRQTGEDPPCLRGACSVRNPLGLTYDVDIDLNVDDEYCLYQDGALVDCRTDWTVTGSYRFRMESGCHVLAVEGRDVFGLISAFIAVVRVDGAVVSLSGDGTWVIPPAEPPPADWRDVAFDDSTWTPAVPCTNTSPWGGAPAPLRALGAQWIWDDPAGDCFAALGEAYFRLELTLP